MRIVLMHPNYHSGGAEIAGNWPPAWVAYLTGYLKAGGYTDVHFVDAMTHHLDDDQVRARIEELKPDIVGLTAITPAIYKAERLLQIAKEERPQAVTVRAAEPPTAPEQRTKIARGQGERRETATS